MYANGHYKLNGLLRLIEPLEFRMGVIDQMKRDIAGACHPETLILNDGEMLEVEVAGDMSQGQRVRLNAVIAAFACQYAVGSSLFGYEYVIDEGEGKEDVDRDILPMLSRTDVMGIEALLDNGDATAGVVSDLKGIECIYIDDGTWLTNHRQIGRDGIRAILMGEREDEIIEDPSAESDFLSRRSRARSL